MQGSSKHLNPLWKPWVLIATLIAVLAVMAGVPPFFIAIVAICPLMMATMHGGKPVTTTGNLVTIAAATPWFDHSRQDLGSRPLSKKRRLTDDPVRRTIVAAGAGTAIWKLVAVFPGHLSVG